MASWIAFDSDDNLHYIIRVIPREQYSWAWNDRGLSKELNSLITVKSPAAFMRLVDALPPIVPCAYFGGRQVAYLREEIEDGSLMGMEGCNTRILESEFFLESSKPMRSNKVKLDKLVTEWGSDGRTVASLLKGIEGDFVVLVEPLQDWMTLRNSLSLCARLLAGVEHGSGLLKGLGFDMLKSKRLGKELWGIAFKYNPFYSKKIALRDEDRFDPLFYALTDQYSEKTNVPFMKRELHGLCPEDHSVFVTTRQIATGHYDAIGPNKEKTPSEKTLYLCVAGGDGGKESSKEIIRQFSWAFRHLAIPQGNKASCESVDCGWRYDQRGEFQDLAGPKMVPGSFASALWYQLVYHPHDRLTRCKWCGDALMARSVGTPKEFCCGSCRVQYGRSQKGR